MVPAINFTHVDREISNHVGADLATEIDEKTIFRFRVLPGRISIVVNEVAGISETGVNGGFKIRGQGDTSA